MEDERKDRAGEDESRADPEFLMELDQIEVTKGGRVCQPRGEQADPDFWNRYYLARERERSERRAKAAEAREQLRDERYKAMNPSGLALPEWEDEVYGIDW